MTDHEAWAALRSPAGWHGYTANEPQPGGLPWGGSWFCILALIVGEHVHYWPVRDESAEAVRTLAVATVREWAAE